MITISAERSGSNYGFPKIPDSAMQDAKLRTEGLPNFKASFAPIKSNYRHS
jgi:hypothetical protein